MITITVTGETLKEVLEKLLNIVDTAKVNLDAAQSSPLNIAPAAPAPVNPVPAQAHTSPAGPMAPAAAGPAVVPTAPPPAPPTYAPPAAPQPPATVPTAPAPTYTLEQISKAGADLISANPQIMPQINALLPKYGVQSLNQVKPEQYGAVAADLRALGAAI